MSTGEREREALRGALAPNKCVMLASSGAHLGGNADMRAGERPDRRWAHDRQGEARENISSGDLFASSTCHDSIRILVTRRAC